MNNDKRIAAIIVIVASALLLLDFILKLLKRYLNNRHFDFFISYKSQDVQLARRIADHLIANGYSVWFAEYRILLNRRERFQQAIDHGLRHSSYGIAITNNNYIHSQYCAHELEDLLRCCGPGKIIDVMVPRENEPAARYPELKSCHWVESSDLNTILGAIGKMAGINLPRAAELVEDPNRLYEGDFDGASFTINFTGWDITSHGNYYNGIPGQGVEFRYVNNFTGFMFANLYFGTDISPESHRRFTQPDNDDRELYNTIMDYSRKFTANLGARVSGVHLLFYKGMSQFAITYRNQGLWMRKCSMTLLHPISGMPVEFVFTFGFMGDYRSYFQYTSIMDRLALSIKWE